MNKNLLPTFDFLCFEYDDCGNCPFDKEYYYCWKECQEEFRNLPLDEQNEMVKNFEGSKYKMIISSETAKKAKDTLAKLFYNYLSSFVVELDPNDKEAEDWLVERTNRFVRLTFPLLCEDIGIEEEE